MKGIPSTGLCVTFHVLACRIVRLEEPLGSLGEKFEKKKMVESSVREEKSYGFD